MEGFDFPMSFGKKAVKKVDTTQTRVDKTKRSDDPSITSNRDSTETSSLAAGSSVKRLHSDLEARPSNLLAQNGQSSGSRYPVNQNNEDHDGQDDDDDDDDDDDLGPNLEDEDQFPVTHEIILKDHTKVLSAIALDGPGARIATGSHDYDVKIWDFGGMDAKLKPFKSFEPSGSYPIHEVAFSPDGKHLLVIAGMTQPKLYTREGEDGVVFNKGDPYIRDMRHTNGHVAEITGASWHPKSSQEFITCSNDSTIRIWNVEHKMKQKSVIVVKSKDRGARTQVTACAYSHDGKLIAGACKDGALHIWKTDSNFTRPALSNEEAHAKGTETSCVVFSKDGRHVVTRGGDDAVKLWDVKSLKKPLFVATGLTNIYPETNIIFSPDEKMLLTGVAVEKGKKGEVVVLKREGLDEDRRIVVGEGNVIKVLWHSRINQIFATTSKGACHILYSPNKSIHGALLPLAKMPKTTPREQVYTSNLPPMIMTPHALPAFKDQDYHQTKRQQEKARMDPVKSHRPMEPVKGAGKGGRVGASATQHLVQHMFKENNLGEDPREALLKYAEMAENDPKWTTAWQKNQPKAVFSAVPDEDEDEQRKKKAKR